MGAVRFEVMLGLNAKYQFKIFGRDEALVVTSKGYQDKDTCMEAIRAVKENCQDAGRYVKKTLEGGKAEFVLKAPNHQVVVEGGPYENAEACEAAVMAVRGANQAAVIDRA